MPPFRYDSYDNRPWAMDIAAGMRRKGDISAEAALRTAQIQADAQRQNGQIWAGAAQTIGQQVGGVIQQQNDPRRQADQIALDRLKQERSGELALQKLQTPTMPNGPMAGGETRTPQNPYMKKEGDTWVWDTSALGEAMAAQGKPLTPQLLKSIGDFNETNRQEMQHRVQYGATQQKLVGQAAGVLAGLLRAHPDTDLNAAGSLIGQQFAANGSFPLDKFNATFQQVASDPSTALAKLEALSRIGAEPIKLGDNDKLLNSNDPGGAPLATNPKPPTPGQGDYTGPDGIRYHADGSKVTGDVMKPQHVPVPKSYQKTSMLVDGKPTEVFIDPDPAAKQKVFDLDGNPITNAASRAKPIPPASTQVSLTSATDAKSIADAIVSGDQPPDVKGLYRLAGPVRAELAKQGYDMTKANLDWEATKKHLSTLNGAQQTRLRQAISTASDSLGVIEDLAKQWDGGKFPVLNKAALTAAVNGAMGPKAQQIATNLTAQITDVTSELGNVYMGGNSPTDHALSLAGKNLSADWTRDQLLNAIKLARTNLQIRNNSIVNSGAITSSNTGSQTTPQGGSAPIKVGGFTVVVK